MRTLAWLLAAYAVSGVILLGAALLVGAPLISRVDRVATSAAGTMTAAAEAADAAADAFTGFDASLSSARTSATDAAGLTRETAATLDALASAMSLSIFGSQPLLPMADQFERSAGQLRQIGDNLDDIGTALVTNRDDVARVGVRMRALADELAALQGRVGVERTDAGGGPPLAMLFYGFLAWQLLPIAAAAIGSAWLFRRTREAVIAPAAAEQD